MDGQALLHFWFGELRDGVADQAHTQRWFTPDPAFDQACAAEFQAQLDQIRDGALDAWLQTPSGRLAYIILCDQLPRNIYRGTAQAFAWDDLALNAAREGIRQRHDQDLAWDERSFFYMPFEHSEDLLDQHTCVGLFSQLREQCPAVLRNRMGNNLSFARQHRDIIQRFGRFPHRNALLGRSSSAQEQAFVAQGPGFGQTAAQPDDS